MNNLALSVDLATAPSSAFDKLRERPRFWFPLLLLIASTAALNYWYFSAVDIEWLKDLIFSNNTDLQKLPEDQRAAAMAFYGRNTMLWGTVISIILGMPIVFLIFALCLLLAAKVTKLPQELGFKHWFAFACWTSLPLLLSTVVAAILLLMSDTTQISPGVVQPLSLNELVFHRPLGSPGQGLLDTLSIPVFLGWALMIIGVRAWSQRSWVFSALFILVPTAVIYGIWAFFAFR